MTQKPDIDALFAPVAAEPALGLAVSGGADSLALMLLAARWAGRRPVRLVVYTLDHGLRPEAAGEAAMVVREAQRLGLDVRALRWDGEKPGTGIQAAARQARYRLIGAAMAADNVRVLATAHHTRDQAETVLMRLAHGSGLGGLAGMRVFSEVEGIALFRPLLALPPALLRQIVAEAGLHPAEDPGNADPHYERVRWRAMVPHLAGLGLDEAVLAGFARRAGEADAVVEAVAGQVFDRCVRMDLLGRASLAAGDLAAELPAVGQRLLQTLLDRVGGGRRPHGLAQIEALYADLADPDFGKRTLAGCIVRRQGAAIWVVREPGRHIPQKMQIRAGEARDWDRRFAIANDGSNDVIVAMASDWNRARAKALTGTPFAGPVDGLRSAPVVTDMAGNVLALGQYRFASAIRVHAIMGAR